MQVRQLLIINQKASCYKRLVFSKLTLRISSKLQSNIKNNNQNPFAESEVYKYYGSRIDTKSKRDLDHYQVRFTLRTCLYQKEANFKKQLK